MWNGTTNKKRNNTLEKRKHLKKIFDTLDNYKELKPNWDSYGADKIKDEAIQSAKLLVDKISNFINPRSLLCFPVADGCVQIEFVLGDISFEVEVLNNDEVGALIQKGQMFVEIDSYTVDTMAELVKETYTLMGKTFIFGDGI